MIKFKELLAEEGYLSQTAKSGMDAWKNPKIMNYYQMEIYITQLLHELSNRKSEMTMD